MSDGAELRLATDDPDYFSWMLECVTGHPAFAWLARRPGDWRERPPDWPPTRYEEKARAAGRPSGLPAGLPASAARFGLKLREPSVAAGSFVVTQHETSSVGPVRPRLKA